MIAVATFARYRRALLASFILILFPTLNAPCTHEAKKKKKKKKHETGVMWRYRITPAKMAHVRQNVKPYEKSLAELSFSQRRPCYLFS